MILRKVDELVCCPNCRSTLATRATVLTISGIVLNGRASCTSCLETVAEIYRGKYDFLNIRAEADLETSVVRLPYEVERRFIPWQGLNIKEKLGFSTYTDGSLLAENAGASIEFTCECLELAVLCRVHPWSGKLNVYIDDELVECFNLFHPNGLLAQSFWLPGGPKLTSRKYRLELCDESDPLSYGTQMFFHGCYIVVPARQMIIQHASVNRGNPYPSHFVELLEYVSPDGTVLDCGSGDRSLDDPRIVNFEYLKYEEPDIYGDGHRLPFRDESFDLILSQAVLEHMEDPFIAAREMARVLKPGGLIYAEAAFMQPLHGVPYHYFNHTVLGVEKLFSMLVKVKSDWAGNLSDTFRWLLQVSGGFNHLSEGEYQGLQETFERLDLSISHEQLMHIASFVKHWATKPGTMSCVSRNAEAFILGVEQGRYSLARNVNPT